MVNLLLLSEHAFLASVVVTFYENILLYNEVSDYQPYLNLLLTYAPELILYFKRTVYLLLPSLWGKA